LKITIIAVAKIKEKYILKGMEEYIKRLTSYCTLQIKEVDAQKVKSSITIDKIKELEAEKLMQHVADHAYLIALDEHGKEYNSVELAQNFKNITELSGKSEICLLIGGANGLSADIIQKADLTLSLSKLTFPHQLVRLILLEQLYRAFKIIKNEPYHK
jgi:23S rRNA (pseudouridine1915-N3)-methyltransferase